MEDKANAKGKSVPLQVRRALRQSASDLAAWRKIRGLTQAQLADRAGVGTGVISRVEAGDGGVSLENMFRIYRALGILDTASSALDPLLTDVGRLRADEGLPRRVRPRDFGGSDE